LYFPTAEESHAVTTIAKAPRNKFLELQQNSSSANKNILKPKTKWTFVRSPEDSHPSRALIENLNLPIIEMYAESFDEPKFLERTLQNVPLHWIDTEDGLKEMYGKLKSESIIAVDLEHHSFHSYTGLVSLIQISSSTEDFLIDPILLREALQSPELSLNSVLADPKILKIFHGAESDIAWLQRDFDTLVVNMFDSFHAAKVLNLPRMSLAYLLETFCGVELDKKYQLADWRERPIPEEMVEYARKDTHYLVHLYFILKGRLTESQFEQVLQKSNKQCLEAYAPDNINERSWKVVLDRSNYPLFGDQVETVRKLFYWRESRAKELDVSPAALLQNSLLAKIAHSRARSVDDLRGCLRNVSTIMMNEFPALSAYLQSDESRETEFVTAPIVSNTTSSIEPEATKSSHIRFEAVDSSKEAIIPAKRVRQVSFASSTSGGSGIFGGSESKPSSNGQVLLVGLLRESLPKVHATEFITKEREATDREELARLATEKAKKEQAADELNSFKAMVHGSNRVVENLDIFAGGNGSKSTHLADKLRKNIPAQNDASKTANFEAFDYSKEPADVNNEKEEEPEVFDPYSTIKSEKKRAFIEATIAPATAPRLSSTRLSGNRMSTFTKKNK